MGLRVFVCGILMAVPAHAAPLLSIDFNHRLNTPAGSTQAGFTSFIINSNSSATAVQSNTTVRLIGTHQVSLSATPFHRGYTDRSHAMPTNQGAFTESLLLRDGVYSPDARDGGLNILITNLPATNRVQVTVWSYDWLSGPIRASDWYANGVLLRRAFQFTNSPSPVSNEQCRFTFTAMVDSAGRLLIEGRRNAMSTNEGGLPHPAVYLNALRIDREPLEILKVEPSGTELRLTFVVWPQPGSYVVEEFTGGQWRDTIGVVYGAAVNNRVTARFPRPNGARLYRVRYNY
jgi:hypothetical protein